MCPGGAAGLESEGCVLVPDLCCAGKAQRLQLDGAASDGLLGLTALSLQLSRVVVKMGAFWAAVLFEDCCRSLGKKRASVTETSEGQLLYYFWMLNSEKEIDSFASVVP